MLMGGQSKKHNLATGSNFFNAAAQFLLSTVTVNAESVDSSTPAARVTWSTTTPPECVTSVRVEFRTEPCWTCSIANYTTTNTSKVYAVFMMHMF